MVLSSLRGFIDRHKKKFIITGAVIGGSIITFRYIQKKLKEFQENQTKELIEKTKHLNHFESIERTCNQVIVSLSSSLFNEIIRLLNTNDILEQLRNNPNNKIELWNKLKIISFTRLTTLVYATSMLVIALRIQLNILGGYLYKDTVSEQAKISDEIRESYLSIQYFITDGLQDLIHLIQKKVEEILNSHELSEKLNLSDLEQIFWSIQMAVNSDIRDPNSNISFYILPPTINENNQLEKMFNETLDMLESDDVATLCANNVSRGFSIVIDHIAEYYAETGKVNGTLENNNTKITKLPKMRTTTIAAAATTTTTTAERTASTTKTDLNTFVNINAVELHLAKILPIINGLTSKNFDATSKPPNLPTSLITFFLVSEKIKILGANVYEAFST